MKPIIKCLTLLVHGKLFRKFALFKRDFELFILEKFKCKILKRKFKRDMIFK